MWNQATDKLNGPTAERVRELFDYDPDTGVVKRKITVSNNGKKGAIVGCKNSTDGYLVCHVDHFKHKRLFQLHRIIWLWMTGEWPECQIDHKNKNRSDNTWKNLRLANQGQQNINQDIRKDNTTGVKGVVYDKSRNLYRARINVNKKEIMLGRFETLEEAKEKRRQAEIKYYGEFALKE